MLPALKVPQVSPIPSPTSQSSQGDEREEASEQQQQLCHQHWQSQRAVKDSAVESAFSLSPSSSTAKSCSVVEMTFPNVVMSERSCQIDADSIEDPSHLSAPVIISSESCSSSSIRSNDGVSDDVTGSQRTKSPSSDADNVVKFKVVIFLNTKCFSVSEKLSSF